MINSMYYRGTDQQEAKDSEFKNVDILIYIMGRPNYHRSVPTVDSEDEVKDITLLILNGYVHKKFREHGHN